MIYVFQHVSPGLALDRTSFSPQAVLIYPCRWSHDPSQLINKSTLDECRSSFGIVTESLQRFVDTAVQRLTDTPP
jgi:hypothetical protein